MIWIFHWVINIVSSVSIVWYVRYEVKSRFHFVDLISRVLICYCMRSREVLRWSQQFQASASSSSKWYIRRWREYQTGYRETIIHDNIWDCMTYDGCFKLFSNISHVSAKRLNWYSHPSDYSAELMNWYLSSFASGVVIIHRSACLSSVHGAFS